MIKKSIEKNKLCFEMCLIFGMLDMLETVVVVFLFFIVKWF